MEAFRKNQQQFQDAMQGAFSGGPFAEIAKRNMEMFGAATSAFKGATSEKKASTAAEEKDDEIAQLKAQLELLNSKIDRLGTPSIFSGEGWMCDVATAHLSLTVGRDGKSVV